MVDVYATDHLLKMDSITICGWKAGSKYCIFSKGVFYTMSITKSAGIQNCEVFIDVKRVNSTKM